MNDFGTNLAGAPVNLRAHDLEDLSIIGGLVQDALAPPGDLRFDKDQNQFIALINRFRWEATPVDQDAGDEVAGGSYSRTHAGLRFDGVRRAQFKGFDWSNPEKMHALLTVVYDPDGAADDAGSTAGVVALHFSGGAAVRLIVDDLRCVLSDLGEPWPTQWKPGHEPADDPAKDSA